MTPTGRILDLILSMTSRLPLGLCHALGRMIGWLLMVIPNRNRRIAERNLELCYPNAEPGWRRRIVRAHMRGIGEGFMELGWCYRRAPEDLLGKVREVHGQALFETAIADGHGVLLAAPHLGAWEFLGQYLALKVPASFMYKAPRDAGVDELIKAGRSRLGCELIPADSRGARAVFKAIKSGRLIGILPDQQPKAGQGEFAPFFGIPALTMVLYSKLAQKSDVPIVFAYAERLPRGQGYDLHFLPGDPALRDPDLATSVAALNRSVEACARQCPEQYVWGYKRFSIRPEGEPPLY